VLAPPPSEAHSAPSTAPRRPAAAAKPVGVRLGTIATMAAGVGKEGKGSDLMVKTHRFLFKTPGKEKQRKKGILAFSCGDGLTRDHAAERLDGRGQRAQR